MDFQQTPFAHQALPLSVLSTSSAPLKRIFNRQAFSFGIGVARAVDKEPAHLLGIEVPEVASGGVRQASGHGFESRGVGTQMHRG